MREVVLAAINENVEALNYASERLFREFLSSYGYYKDFVISDVIRCGTWRNLEYVSSRLKDDKDVVLEAISQHGDALQHASKRLKDDKDVVLEAISQHGDALQHASERLKDDKDVVMEAVKQNGDLLQHASERLKNDRDVVLEAVKSSECDNPLQYVSEDFKEKLDECEDKEWECLKQLESSYDKVTQCIRDKEKALAAVKQDASNYYLLSRKLQKDRELLLEAIKRDHMILEINDFYFNDSYLKDIQNVIFDSYMSDRDFVLEAVKRNGLVIWYLEGDLAHDTEIIAEALKQEVNEYLESHNKGAASKAEGGELLIRTEALKKKTKKSYRTIDSLIDDEVPTSAEVLREQLAQHQKDLNQLRDLRKQLKEACNFSKEELDSCKVRMKPKEGDEDFQTDSSDEDNMSREDQAFNKGTIKGIAEGVIAAFEDSGKGMKGLWDLITTNPNITKERIIELLEVIPELPGLFCAYLEELSEADEEKRAEEIAKFITEQVILFRNPAFLPANVLAKAAKIQLGMAAMKLAEKGIKLTGRGKDKIGNLIRYKDKNVREVHKLRGGNASAFSEMRTDYIDKALGEIANLEATGDSDARTIMKLVKQARKKAEKY